MTSPSIHSSLYPPVYRGSVKDLLGPVTAAPVHGSARSRGMVFEYTDAYSVFDWGRMPDALAHKGEALAVLAADWFEKLENAQSWKEFSRDKAAHGLRKANRFGSAFIELGEKLQSEGLRTHYVGVIDKLPSQGSEVSPVRLSDVRLPVRHLVVREVSVVKPSWVSVLGRQLPDYTGTRISQPPRLVPLEVVFRFGVPKGSSLIERVKRDPGYMASLGFGASGGFGEYEVHEGAHWDFPILELFTKLEPSDRPVGLGEALAISGLTGAQLNELLMKTAWVAAWLRAQVARAGLELADGKLEWGLDSNGPEGSLFLVDAVGPDELRILNGPASSSGGKIQLSKEFLRTFYRGTTWYAHIEHAKAGAKKAGASDWKKLVGDPPPHLSPEVKTLADQLYPALCNELTGKRWFSTAWPLSAVIEGIRKTEGEAPRA